MCRAPSCGLIESVYDRAETDIFPCYKFRINNCCLELWSIKIKNLTKLGGYEESQIIDLSTYFGILSHGYDG